MKLVVFDVAFSPDGRRLAAATNDGLGPKPWVVKVWDTTQTGQNPLTIRDSQEIFCLAFSPDGRWLALGTGDGSVKLCDAASGAPIGLVGKHDGDVREVAFHPDGQRLASGDGNGTVKVWDLTYAWLPGLALFSPFGCTTALPLSAAVQPQLASWIETNGPKPLWTLPRPDPEFECVAFSPDGRRLVSTGRDRLRLWNAETGQPVDTVPGQVTGFHKSVAFSPDGRWLYSAAQDCTVKVWDAATLAWKHSFRGHRGPICGIAVSPNGQFLVTSSADKTVKVWNLTRLDWSGK
jgi:WD40 repeat protein